MNVLARSDWTFGKADDLVVALHRFAGVNRARSDLVTGRHETGDSHFLVEQRSTRDELLARDYDVVIGMQADRERGLGQHEWLLRKPSAHCRRDRAFTPRSAAPSCSWFCRVPVRRLSQRR